MKSTSSLETIEGVGPKRRQMLLKYMVGCRGYSRPASKKLLKYRASLTLWQKRSSTR
ncbi:hypothetical protein LNP05_21645 [Klebsiella pneumoniae subsp. pneumoniae]|nr:hypothetical protein [Klebsiella pneumoniae subsp. pneumoniae]